MDPLMLSYWIAIGSAVLMLGITLFVAAKLRKTRKHGVVRAKQSETQISGLQGRFNDLQQEIKKARSDYSQAQSEMSELKEIESRANSQVHELKRTLEEISGERDQLRREIGERNQLAVRAEEELRKRSLETEDLSAQLADRQARVADLEQSEKELSAQLAALQEKLLFAEEEKEDHLQTIMRQDEELKASRLRQRELEDSLSESQSRNKSASARLEELEAQLDDLRQENLHRQEAIQHRQAELESLLNELAGLKNSLAEQQGANRALAESNEESSVRIVSLESAAADFEKSRQDTQEIIARQRDELEVVIAERARLKQSLSELESSNQLEAERIQELEAELDELKRQRQAASETIAHQKEKLEALGGERNTLAAEKAEAEAALVRLQESSRGSEKRIEELDLELRGLRDENEAARESLNRLRQEQEESVEERAALRDQLRESEDLAASLKEQADELSVRYRELQSSFDALTSRGTEDEQRIAEQARQLERAGTESSRLSADLKQSRELAVQARERIEELEAELQSVHATLEGLEKARQSQAVVIGELKKDIAGRQDPAGQGEASGDPLLAANPQMKFPREEVLMELLLDKQLMKRPAVEKAIALKQKHGGSLLRHLFVHRDIDEKKLVECITDKFSVPYLPLGMYDIDEALVAALPRELAEKYWVFPLDRIENKLMVVMVDPFDKEAIAEISRASGCAVQVYIGMVSEVAEKIKTLYKVNIRGLDAEGNLVSPLFIATDGYKGRERRRAVRYDARLALKVIMDTEVFCTMTEDISLDGLACKLERELPEYATVGIELSIEGLFPEGEQRYPLTAVAQVRKVKQLGDESFFIGLEFCRVAASDIEALIRQVSALPAQPKPGKKKMLIVDSQDTIRIE